MLENYRNLISSIDLDRNVDAVVYNTFEGYTTPAAKEFLNDIETDNDPIEMHLVKSSTYKEMLLLSIKNATPDMSKRWMPLIQEEQKTFGGSKIFYTNSDCSKILVLSIKEEMQNKLNMVVSRLNKINDKIKRINSEIRKENAEIYTENIKKAESPKTKDDIINLINNNLRV